MNIYDKIRNAMSNLGFKQIESVDCIEFEHCDGSHLEFDSWHDVIEWLSNR